VKLLDGNSFSGHSAGNSRLDLTVKEVQLWRNW
jgi:hypothetical protein